MSSLHLAFASERHERLCDLSPGESGTVVHVEVQDAHRSHRLMALGVTPGAKITVLQTFPGVVFLCDQTELAVEHAVAAVIVIRRG
jgi:DtxR family Mn-dependent transcriptional regulator